MKPRHLNKPIVRKRCDRIGAFTNTLYTAYSLWSQSGHNAYGVRTVHLAVTHSARPIAPLPVSDLPHAYSPASHPSEHEEPLHAERHPSCTSETTTRVSQPLRTDTHTEILQVAHRGTQSASAAPLPSARATSRLQLHPRLPVVADRRSRGAGDGRRARRRPCVVDTVRRAATSPPRRRPRPRAASPLRTRCPWTCCSACSPPEGERRGAVRIGDGPRDRVVHVLVIASLMQTVSFAKPS